MYSQAKTYCGDIGTKSEYDRELDKGESVKVVSDKLDVGIITVKD